MKKLTELNLRGEIWLMTVPLIRHVLWSMYRGSVSPIKQKRQTRERWEKKMTRTTRLFYRRAALVINIKTV